MVEKKTSKPLTDHEKQIRPMPGEVSPERAHQRARAFAARERNLIKSKKHKSS